MSSRARYALVALFAAAAVACLLLGRWQVRRLHERRAANAAALARRSAPPVALAAGARRPPAAELAERRVTAVGTYDHARELVLHAQVHAGTPGVVVVTPLRLPGSDTAVLVRRGFIPTPDAMSAPTPAPAEPGTVRVTGIAAAIPSTAGGGDRLERRGRTTWRYLDRAALATLPYPVLPIEIRQLPDSTLPSFPRRVPAPPLDDGPHLGYAIQWFAFATTALVFAGVFLRRGSGAR
jgi:surfeit locus 1 family protein